MLGMLGAQITKEAVNSAQADIACAGLAASVRFHMLKELGNLFRAQLLNFQQAGIALPRGELEQQLQAVSVTLKGVRTQGTLPRQIIGEEPMEGTRQSGIGPGVHRTPPKMQKACWWKRSLAACRKSGVKLK
jgi:hypothetical protein